MSHLDEGTIVALRDRGPTPGDTRRHLEECVVCRDALAEARRRAESVEHALEALRADPDVESAKAEVRKRLDARRDAGRHRSSRLVWSLGRAAGLVLLFSGVVYALPNSPLRAWLHSDPPPDHVGAPSITGLQRPDPEEGIEIEMPPEGLRIVLNSVDAGTRIEIRWLDAGQARIVAAAGSRYAISEGRAEAGVVSGPVRVDVPRDGSSITIEVNGRMILERIDGSLDVMGDVVSRSADRIVFSTGER